MVTTNVYSHDRQHLLIPQGTRVLGEVHRVDHFGQERVAVFFHRLIMPDGYSLSLDRFHGLNQVGETGLKDKVIRTDIYKDERFSDHAPLTMDYEL